MIQKKYILGSIVFILYYSNLLFGQLQNETDVIVVPKAQSRSFMLTNNRSTFFFSETGSQNTSSMQGLNVGTVELLEDYILEVNGKPLNRKDSEAFLYPNKVVRKYSSINFEEEVTLMDSLSVLSIKLKSSQKIRISIIPIISKEKNNEKYIQLWSGEDRLLFIAPKNLKKEDQTENNLLLTGIFTYPNSEYLDISKNSNKTYVGFAKKKDFLPGKLDFYLDGTAHIFIIVGKDKQHILNMRKQALQQFNIYIDDKKQKIDGLRST